MPQNAVLFDIDVATGIATVTLNRTEAINVLDNTLCTHLRDALCQAELNSDIRAVVVQGAWPHFAAGGDIKGFHAKLEHVPTERRQWFEKIIASAHESIIQIWRMEKPVLASVQGAVAGFGLSLMNSCDLAIAADDAYFTMASCNIGVSPHGGSTYGLPRIVGLKRAMEIALLGERFNARQALELGLINRVVPVTALADSVRSMAMRLAAGPTRALGRTKRLLNDSLNSTLIEQLLAEQESFACCAMEADFECGVRAFVEKRKPVFKGR
ncbi:enoyl-CoA hydratase-related protein [Ralstonia sp.]|uniref:enoyl-CoA hydratase-related protein n=1 Tax=Ralstonia sp. TaxID=54061 RepID=UPI0031CDEFB7